mgnify:CR=1 FL=1
MATETPTTKQETPVHSAPSSAPVQTTKNSMAGKIVLGIIGVVVVFGIYASATGNRAPETPEGVVSRMMYAMKGVTSGEFAGTFDTDIQGAKNPLASLENFGQSESVEEAEAVPMKATIGVSGQIHASNVEQVQTSVKVTLASPDFPEGQSGEVEFMMNGKDRYFKLNKIPMVGKLNLSSLTGNWVNLDTQALKEQFGSEESGEEVVSTTPMSDDSIERIKEVIVSGKILEVVEDMGDSSVGGVSVYHYKVSLNESEVMRVAREVHEITQGAPMSIEEEKKMTEFWANTEVENGQVWIGKKDFYLYGISFGMKTQNVGEEKSSGAIIADVQMRNFNKPVTIQPPQNSSSITDFVGQVFGIIMAQSFSGSMMGGGQ